MSSASKKKKSKKEAKRIFGIYRDDFYDEVQFATLIHYYKRGALDLKMTEVITKEISWFQGE